MPPRPHTLAGRLCGAADLAEMRCPGSTHLGAGAGALTFGTIGALIGGLFPRH